MRAIVQERYGSPDRLELRDIPEPTAGEGEVLVRVRAASIHPDVWHAVTGYPRVLRIMGGGLRRPKNPVPGIDVAGVVQSAGPGATRFAIDDEVFGQTVEANLWRNGGTFAELVAVREGRLEPMPANLSFEEAAAVAVPARIALRSVRDEGAVKAGQHVLVNGAGGGVGMFAVQIAKAFGAHVTGVDRGDKLDLLRSIGCEAAIDHEREDFTRAGERYDLVVDIPGNRPFSEVRRALTPDGSYVLIGHDHFGTQGRRWLGSLGTFAKLMLMSPFVKQLPGLRGSTESKDALAEIARLAAEGKIAPVLDRTFSLAEVPEAIRYLAEGKARGRIVIVV